MERMPERQPEMRASDADRERCAAVLRDAYADGRLSHDEHTERLEQAWTARTLGDLVPLVADLPGSPVGASAPYGQPVATVAASPVVAVFGGAESKPAPGTERLVVTAIFGGADIDLRDALGPGSGGRTVHVTVNVIFGGADMIVPEGVDVRMGGFAVFGGNSAKTGSTKPGAPILRVDGLSLFGGVDVRLARHKEL